MLAHALLAVIAAHEHAARPAPAGLIALTCNEVRRLLTVLVIEPGRVLASPEAWSTWRRRHQHQARTVSRIYTTPRDVTPARLKTSAGQREARRWGYGSTPPSDTHHGPQRVGLMATSALQPGRS